LRIGIQEWFHHDENNQLQLAEFEALDEKRLKAKGWNATKLP